MRYNICATGMTKLGANPNSDEESQKNYRYDFFLIWYIIVLLVWSICTKSGHGMATFAIFGGGFGIVDWGICLVLRSFVSLKIKHLHP